MEKVKKFILILLCIIILNSIFIKNFANNELSSSEITDEVDEIETLEIIETSGKTAEEPETYSKHIICMERTTGEILFEKDAYTQTAMASTTKILTAIIALENCELSEEVTISKIAANTGGSTLGIIAETKVSMESLMYGLLLRSGNDCAVAIAEHISGSVENFAELMNEKAKDLGLKNSHFVTPHGLDDENHYSTAYDMAVLTNYALNIEKFKTIVGTKTISIMVGDCARTITNTNELLGNCEGVYGVKTGFTGNAGRCLITACKRDDLNIIIVVLGADTKNIRGLDTRNIINYVFENFEMVDTREKIEEAFENFKNLKTIKASKSMVVPEIKLEEKSNFVYPINKNEISNLQTSIFTLNNIDSQTASGSKIGSLNLKCNDKILYSIDIVLENEITRTTWQDYFKTFILNYKNYFKIYV